MSDIQFGVQPLPSDVMYLPLNGRHVKALVSDNARWSFQRGHDEDEQWHRPVLVKVNASKLSAALPSSAGVWSIDSMARVERKLDTEAQIEAPVVCLMPWGNPATLHIKDGTHTLDRLLKVGCEEVCLAVPQGQAALFAERFA